MSEPSSIQMTQDNSSMVCELPENELLFPADYPEEDIVEFAECLEPLGAKYEHQKYLRITEGNKRVTHKKHVIPVKLDASDELAVGGIVVGTGFLAGGPLGAIIGGALLLACHSVEDIGDPTEGKNDGRITFANDLGLTNGTDADVDGAAGEGEAESESESADMGIVAYMDGGTYDAVGKGESEGESADLGAVTYADAGTGDAAIGEGESESEVCETTVEICDDVDNDCNESFDEGCDDDNDDFCDSAMRMGPAGASTCTGTPPGGMGNDCEDLDFAAIPGSIEICNNIDDNCDASIDEGCDDDNDNFCDAEMRTGPAGADTCTSTPVDSIGNDCNDYNSLIYPGRVEICNDTDEDCNSQTDEGCDDDNDNFCDVAMRIGPAGASACTGTPVGVMGNDCNDIEPLVNPGREETCNDINDDCDTDTDEDCDDDNDNYCDLAMQMGPSGASTCMNTPVGNITGNDCNDSNSAIYPTAAEVEGDGLDNNCDGYEHAWTSITGVGDNEAITGVAADADGGAWVTGFANRIGEDTNAWCNYVDADGSFTPFPWINSFNVTGRDRGNGITLDSTGENVLIAGMLTIGSRDGVLWSTPALTPLAEPAILHQFDGDARVEDTSNDVLAIEDGSRIVISSLTNGVSDTDIDIRRVDDTRTIWRLDFGRGNGQNDRGFGLLREPGSDIFYAVGKQPSGSSGRLWLGAFGIDGSSRWQRTYDSIQTRDANTKRIIALDENGRLQTAAEEAVAGSGSNANLYTVDPANGDILLTRPVVGTAGDDWSNAVVVDGFGNRIVAGAYQSSDALLTILNPDGDVIWRRPLNGDLNRNDGFTSLSIEDGGRVFVGGYVNASPGDSIVLQLDPR